jgi:hypothetical protein
MSLIALKKVPDGRRHRYTGSWTIDRLLRRFSFLTIRDDGRMTTAGKLLWAYAAGGLPDTYVPDLAAMKRLPLSGRFSRWFFPTCPTAFMTGEFDFVNRST